MPATMEEYVLYGNMVSELTLYNVLCYDYKAGARSVHEILCEYADKLTNSARGKRLTLSEYAERLHNMRRFLEWIQPDLAAVRFPASEEAPASPPAELLAWLDSLPIQKEGDP